MDNLLFRIDIHQSKFDRDNWIADLSRFGYDDGAARSVTIPELIKIRDHITRCIEEMQREEDELAECMSVNARIDAERRAQQH